MIEFDAGITLSDNSIFRAINAGSRSLGISYSVLINGLSKNSIILDRKILSDLAICDSSTFEKIVKTAVS